MNNYSIISNSTPLIAFIKKNEIILLKSLFNEITIPKAVYEEIVSSSDKLNKEGEILEEEIKKKWIIVKQVSKLKFPELNLRRGETEALNLCLITNHPLLLIDEIKGRNIDKSLKIEILGTLGILALAKEKMLKKEKELLENLDLLINRGIYLSSEVILTFMKNLKA